MRSARNDNPQGFDWLDQETALRQWFSNWFSTHWHHIYAESVCQLHSKDDWKRYDRLENWIKKSRIKLGCFTTAEQISLIDAKARKFGFRASFDRIQDELESFLTRMGKQTEHLGAFKASPWCNYFANEKHILEQAGTNLPYKLYPRDPDMRQALGSVIGEFGSFEILRGVSPALSQLFVVQRTLGQFGEAIKSLATASPTGAAFKKAEPALREFSATLEAEINESANEPAALTSPLRARRIQRAFYYAVRRLCKPKDGPEKLAFFIQNLLEKWPQIPAGMEFDLENYFNTDKRRNLVRDHLGLQNLRSNKEARALWRVLHTVIFRNELRDPLLRLARDADMRAKQRRKGWEHLRHVLKTVFGHIRREASDEAKFRNFERSNFPHMRNLTRAQRMRLLPELGNDPDHSVRDLTKKERMILAARYLKKTRTALEKDADGKNSFATRYGRAMKDVRKELGQD